MRNPFRKTEADAALESQIMAVLKRMDDTDLFDPEYPELLRTLQRMRKLQADNKPKPISLDGVIQGACYLGGIAVIALVERNNIWPKQAASQIGRFNR